MRLDGKRALIVGGAGGIGRAIAARLRAAGAEIALGDKDLISARAAAESIGAGLALQVDVLSRTSIQKMLLEANETLGQIDIFVYTVGVARHRHFLEVSDEDWRHV